ncbi:MAG: carboxypeptidase regulatory-like domain-containing protein [Acidimicrobiia bacterium]|nr:carboxypeptidase regulatory-like domain-containing protein [Acidimicrobiia bacterium]
METRRRTGRLIGVCAGAAIVALALGTVGAFQQQGGVPIDADDLGGVVASVRGAEAGVWVIAETTDTPVGFRRMVVTDHLGRYVVPDLPKGSYTVWTRGYGLVDSEKVKSAPGAQLNLTAVVAPNAKAAAEYYPANYWWSLLEPPAESEFPGTGPEGNGIPTARRSQADYLGRLSISGCGSCHQLGTKVTREMPRGMGQFESTVAAWDRRIQSGQSGAFMSNSLAGFGKERGLQMFADWTDRIRAGELPAAPPRPAGLERNVVVSQWDWGPNGHYFIHDVLSSDKRNPVLNPNGVVYGVPEYSSDQIAVLDPVTNRVEYIQAPVIDENNQPPWSWTQESMQPSPVWANTPVFQSRTTPHSLMMDERLRIWVTSTVRPPDDIPPACTNGAVIPSARKFPMDRSAERNLSMYDPSTKQWTPLNTCFNTHHVQIDWNDVLWFSGTGSFLPWFDIRKWEQTKDVFASQGWIPFILDTNGNGRQDEYVEPDAAVDPAKDRRITAGVYGVIPNRLDGSVWIVQSSAAPGAILRVAPGANPPATAVTEYYEVPLDDPRATERVFGARGIDIDRNGVVWAGLGSGHMASFDRRKCKVLNGPTVANGLHCLEGWTFYQQPGPNFKGVGGSGSADGNYYTFVDQFGAGGLGENIPISFGDNSDSMKAVIPDTGESVVMRVPYPMGFHPKGMDGRIDDPNAGWKGRGLWSAYAGQVMWHMEGGPKAVNKAVKFQVRPSELSR